MQSAWLGQNLNPSEDGDVPDLPSYAGASRHNYVNAKNQEQRIPYPAPAPQKSIEPMGRWSVQTKEDVRFSGLARISARWTERIIGLSSVLGSTRYLGFKGPALRTGELMKTRKLVWLVSLAVVSGLVSLGGTRLSTAVARPQLRADGGDPVPPPPHTPMTAGIPA
jgi:hypothetical protein